MKMKRIVNIRSIFFGAAALITGVLTALKSISFLSVLLIFAGAVCASLIIISVAKRKAFGKYATAIIISAVLFFAGLAGFKIKIEIYKYRPYQLNTDYLISGTVTEDYEYDGSSFSAVLDGLRIGGKKAGGRLSLSIEGLDSHNILQFAGAGDRLTFTGRLKFPDAVRDGAVTYNAVRDIKYTVRMSGSGETTVTGGRMPFFTMLRQRISRNFISVLGEREGGVAVGMLIGSKEGLDPDTSYYYSASGIAHLLSVSGLHISFAAGAVAFLLKKIRGGKYLKFALFSCVLLFYCAICNFTPSAVRALIMAVLASAATLLGERSDSLTNISLAAILILLIDPFALFNISFQMSFAATFGIICLTGLFSTGLKYVPLLKKSPKLIGSLSTILAAQTGAASITMITMQTVSPYVVLANLIIVPVMMAAFAVLFAAMWLSLIIPPLKWIAVIVYPLIWLVNESARLITSIPFATNVVYSAAALTLCVICGIFLCSRFLLKKRVRIVSALLTVILLILFIVPFNTAEKEPPGYTPVECNIGLNTIMYADGYYLAGDLRDSASIMDTLKERRITVIRGVILTDLSAGAIERAAAVIRKYSIKAVYIADVVTAEIGGLPESARIHFVAEGEETVFGAISFKMFFAGNGAGAVIFRHGGKEYLLLPSASKSVEDKINSSRHEFEAVQSLGINGFEAQHKYTVYS